MDVNQQQALYHCARCRRQHTLEQFLLPDGTQRKTCSFCRDRDARARAQKQVHHQQQQPNDPSSIPPNHGAAPPPLFPPQQRYPSYQPQQQTLGAQDLLNSNISPEIQYYRCTRCRKHQPLDLFFLPDGTERRTCAACRERDAKARAMKQQQHQQQPQHQQYSHHQSQSGVGHPPPELMGLGGNGDDANNNNNPAAAAVAAIAAAAAIQQPSDDPTQNHHPHHHMLG